jgi:acylaminoacyl-peptidase
MKSILNGVAAATLLLSLTVSADDFRRFEPMDVFALEWAADPQVSPDGTRIVYVRTAYDKLADRSRGALWMLDIDSGRHRPLITESSVSSPRWSPDGGRIAYRARGEQGAEIRIRYLDDGADFAVAQFIESPGEFAWSPDGEQLAFSMFVADEKPSFATAPKPPAGADWAEPVRVFDDLTFRFDGRGWLRDGETHVFVVSAQGGEPRQLTDGDNGFSSPTWLDADTVLAVGNDVPDAELDPIESEIYAVELEDGSRTALTERDGPDASPAVSPDGERIAYTGYDDRVRAYQQANLYVMNADGSDPRNLSGDYDHPLADPVFSIDGRSVFALAEVEGHTVLVEIGLDGTVRERTDDVGGTSIGRPYASGAFSVGGERASVLAYTRQRWDRPADVAVIDGRADPRVLTDLNDDALAHVDLAEIEEIQVESRHDGRTIEAWVAKPPGFEADGSFPMIIEIHGGPFAMYGPSFAAEIQRYAAEGYVTVYANPRGSTGYGNEFAQQIDLAYPGNDHDDLMSVVDELVERDYVDPERLFITGGSGGGVLTAWAVGKTDRFAAAASIKPVINWVTMATAADIGVMVTRHWFRSKPWENPDLYFRLSPLSLVGNITTPTLVMVGEEDWRTPTWEAEQLYGALKQRQVPTALVRVPGASHYIAARPSQLIAKTDNILGWFEEHDPGADDGGDD